MHGSPLQAGPLYCGATYKVALAVAPMWHPTGTFSVVIRWNTSTMDYGSQLQLYKGQHSRIEPGETVSYNLPRLSQIITSVENIVVNSDVSYLFICSVTKENAQNT